MAAASEDELSGFVTRWNLNATAEALLRGAEPTPQQRILAEFAPRDTSSDANGIFIKFAQGVSRTGGQKPDFSAGGQRGQQPPVQHEVLLAFVERWALGDDAQTFFFEQAPEVQERIMKEFAPRDTSSDVNGIFLKFARGVARSGGGGAYKKGQAFFQQQQTVNLFQQQYQQPLDFQAYCVRWRLGEDAQRMLNAMAPHFQQRVMHEFAPRDSQTDCNAIFMKFCQGMARKGGGKGGNAYAAPLQHAPQTPGFQGGWQQASAPQFQGGWAQAAQPQAQGGASVPDFVTQWRLGPEAQQLLQGLAPTDQAKVMSDFRPRDTASDCNGIFMKFAQGIARKGQGKGFARSSPY